LGGGSTEISIGNQQGCFYAHILRLGAIRLTTRFIGEGWTGHIPTSVYKQMKKYVSSQMASLNPKSRSAAQGKRGVPRHRQNLAEITNRLFKKNGDRSSMV
jgi:exopolyphosphatase/guanosine-5'-triphosphate,3'-diphosphate pyrophosphatase